MRVEKIGINFGAGIGGGLQTLMPKA